ncbi:MAG: hypothetical protein F6K42_26180 [Leptolyngbya sp. SIO1D8]|nr:hypothetical protein [Leptolyngbya sp. SIO1D8]
MKVIIIIIFGFLVVNSCLARLDTIKITSKNLNRDIRIFWYRPESKEPFKSIVYFTDGEKMIENGTLSVIGSLTKYGAIPSAYYVFVSTIDPISGVDYRNEYFFSNPRYLSFFESELIPEIESIMRKVFNPDKRALVGISFGGLNTAYFSAKSKAFKNYALLSPITYPRPGILRDITFSSNKNLKIFISSGKSDAENYVKPLARIYQAKGHNIKTLYTPGGHNFENWNGQLNQALNFLKPRAN